MKSNKKISLVLFTAFSVEEREEKSQELSTAVIEHHSVAEAKASAVKQYNETLTRIESRISDLAKAIRRKGAEKTVDVLVQFHNPVPHLKTLVRIDTGEVVRTEDMSPEEKQENLFDEEDALTDMMVEKPKADDEGRNL